MQVFLRVGVVLSSIAFVACGVDSPHRGLGSKSSDEPLKQDETQVVAAQEVEAPKIMIARIAADEADSEGANVEFVTLNESVRIASASDAARAFEQGRPLNVNNDGVMSLGSPVPPPTQAQASTPVQTPAKVELGAPVQAPVQMGTPCQNPCNGKVVGGGFISVVKARGLGLFNRVGGLLQRLRPRVLLGNGVDYNYANQYAGGNYQYSVYQAAPGKVQNVPVQTPQPATPSQVPASIPAPAPQSPTYGPTPVVTVPGGAPITPQPTGGGRLL